MAITRDKTRSNAFKALNDCHILLIEDQYSIASMAVNMLKEKWNCEVNVANSYQAAKAILETHTSSFF